MLENIFHLLTENDIKRLFNRTISPSLYHDIVKCKFREMIKFWILKKKQKSFTKHKKKILKPVLYNSRYLRTKFSS